MTKPTAIAPGDTFEGNLFPAGHMGETIVEPHSIHDPLLGSGDGAGDRLSDSFLGEWDELMRLERQQTKGSTTLVAVARGQVDRLFSYLKRAARRRPDIQACLELLDINVVRALISRQTAFVVGKYLEKNDMKSITLEEIAALTLQFAKERVEEKSGIRFQRTYNEEKERVA